MARLLDPDGYVFLTISRLYSLECPRRGRWYMDRPDGPPATSAVVGRAGHLVLAGLGKSGWPEDAFDNLPEIVDQALTREGLRFLVPSDEYYRERSALVEALRRFRSTWPLRLPTSPLVEVQAKLTDRLGRLRLDGRLDRLSPPPEPGGYARVDDWKLGRFRDDEEGGVPLAVIGQAALARARLGIRCPVTVHWVYPRAITEDVWFFDRHALHEGFSRVRELAANILADRWPVGPGERCFRCPVVDCEYHVGTPDAADLDFIEPGEEAGE